MGQSVIASDTLVVRLSGCVRPAWLRVDRLLGEKGIPKDSAAGREQFAWLTEERRREDLGAEFKPVERGWCLGSEEFRQELLESALGQMGASHTGAERREAQEAKAKRMIREELKRMGWDTRTLRQVGKGDKRKVRLAARLRRETTMSLKWTGNGQLDLCLQPARRHAKSREV